MCAFLRHEPRCDARPLLPEGTGVDDEVAHDREARERRDLDRVAVGREDGATGQRAPPVDPDAAGPTHRHPARVTECKRRIVSALDLAQEVEYRYGIGRLDCKLLLTDLAALHQHADGCAEPPAADRPGG